MVVAHQLSKPPPSNIPIQIGESSMLAMQKREKSKATELGTISPDHKLKQMRRVNPSPSVGALPMSDEITPIPKHLPNDSQSNSGDGKYALLGAHPASSIDKVKSHN